MWCDFSAAASKGPAADILHMRSSVACTCHTSAKGITELMSSCKHTNVCSGVEPEFKIPY